MAELTIIFDIPQDILEGLETGKYERVGGVIRKTAGKEVVAWLRDGDPVQSEATQELLRQSQQQTQMLQLLGAQQQLLMGLQVANLAVSVAGFALLYLKLDAMQKTLGRIDAKLDGLKQGQEWIDAKQMLAHLAPIQAALVPIREGRLYERRKLLEQQLLNSDGRFAEARSFFYQLIQQLFGRGQAFTQARELEVAYRAWIMAGQGQMQVMAELGEHELAQRRALQLKQEHASFGKSLQAHLSDPLHRLKAEQAGAKRQPLLLSVAQQAIGVHEILSGNVLQLECVHRHRLHMPLQHDVPVGHQGLVMYRVT